MSIVRVLDMLIPVEVLWRPNYGEFYFKIDEKPFDLEPSVAQSIFDDMNRGKEKYRDLTGPRFDSLAPSESPMKPVHQYLRETGYARQYRGLILLEDGIMLGVKGMYTNANHTPCLPAPSDA